MFDDRSLERSIKYYSSTDYRMSSHVTDEYRMYVAWLILDDLLVDTI